MSLNRQEAWKEERPVFYALPEEGYQDNEPTDWMTSWCDLESVNVYRTVLSLYSLANASDCPIEHLDTLAWLVGLSDSYWDTSWSILVKRAMITNAKWLFDNTGTLAAVVKVLDIHSIAHKIWTSRSIQLPFAIPATLGTTELRYIIQVPISVTRDQRTWKEVERTIRNYNPAVVIATVEYEGFTLGFSRLGDAVFK